MIKIPLTLQATSTTSTGRPATGKNKPGFTLIELLVVISIIAILISLLMPALKKAKRNTKLIMCSSNLRQIGIGLGAYVTNYNGRFPPPAGYLGFYQESTGVDNRDALVEISGGRAAWLYFCPLNPRSISHPHQAENCPYPEDPYAKYFYVGYWAGQNTYGASYDFLFLHKDDGVFFSWNWSGAGTLDAAAPYEPLVAQNAIVTDQNSSSPSRGDTWQNPGDVAHSVSGDRYDPFMDANALYGDGHAETHNKPQNYVGRSDGVNYCW